MPLTRKRRLKNPLRCHYCFKVVGCSRHNVMPFHKDADGKRCSGTGRFAAEGSS
jgi:hypothetical protein